MSLSSLRSRRSFTLLELIVVIVVLGVLASISIVGYQSVVRRSHDASARTTLESALRETAAIVVFDQAGGFDVDHIEEAAGDLPDGWVWVSGAAGVEEASGAVSSGGVAVIATESRSGNAAFACISSPTSGTFSWVTSGAADPARYADMVAGECDGGFPPPPLETPDGPPGFTGLTGHLEGNNLHLEWDPHPEATVYQVLRGGPSDDCGDASPVSAALAAGVTAWADESTAPNGEYLYCVVATTPDGELTQTLNFEVGETWEYSYTGVCENVYVPAGAGVVYADLRGAQGGSVPNQGVGGLGGAARGYIPVDEAGETLRVCVGQAGHVRSVSVGPGTYRGGGFNGGGNAWGSTYGSAGAGGGGGATDVRRDSVDGILGNWSLADRILVAGGGGGAAYATSSNTLDTSGGHGSGGPVGGTSPSRFGGQGAVDDHGGLGGPGQDDYAADGSFGVGANGSAWGSSSNTVASAGGGGGWYGGGAGGALSPYVSNPEPRAGGGGGGNGYAAPDVFWPSYATGVQEGHGEAFVTVGVTEMALPNNDPAPVVGFDCTYRPQRFRVPGAVSSVQFMLEGAGPSGRGGRLEGSAMVEPGEIVEVYVGCTNGYNGGGSNANSAGGGGTDFRRDFDDDGTFDIDERVAAAGGGGGAGRTRQYGSEYTFAAGGDGGAAPEWGSWASATLVSCDWTMGAPATGAAGGAGADYGGSDGESFFGGVSTSAGSGPGLHWGGHGGGGWFGGGAGGRSASAALAGQYCVGGGGGGSNGAQPWVDVTASLTGYVEGDGAALFIFDV